MSTTAAIGAPGELELVGKEDIPRPGEFEDEDAFVEPPVVSQRTRKQKSHGHLARETEEEPYIRRAVRAEECASDDEEPACGDGLTDITARALPDSQRELPSPPQTASTPQQLLSPTQTAPSSSTPAPGTPNLPSSSKRPGSNIASSPPVYNPASPPYRQPTDLQTVLQNASEPEFERAQIGYLLAQTDRAKEEILTMQAEREYRATKTDNLARRLRRKAKKAKRAKKLEKLKAELEQATLEARRLKADTMRRRVIQGVKATLGFVVRAVPILKVAGALLQYGEQVRRR